MRQLLVFALLVAMVALGITTTARGHSPYGKALKENYELKAVTCYACHLRGKDEKTGKPLGKEHLNEFGQALNDVLKDKKIKERIESAKEQSAEERQKMNDVAAEEFLKAFGTIKSQANSSGKTWMELIQSGEHEGIRLQKVAAD